MTQGITKTFLLTGTKHMTLRVTVTETYDIEENKSDIQVGLEVANSIYSGHTYYLDGELTAQGQTLAAMSSVAGSHYVYVSQKDTYYAISQSPWSLTGIDHDNNGTKTVSIILNLKGVEANGWGANGWTVSGNLEVELTQIPRASTVGATDANIGAVSMVAISKKHSAYTHSLAYAFGELQGYIAADGSLQEQEVRFGDTSVAFLLPESFYAQIPDAKSGRCTLTCRTYNGETLVGSPETGEFTAVAAEEACRPLLTGRVEDCNPETLAITGSGERLVRYCSHALCTMIAEARKGASIASKTIGGKAVADDSITIENIAASAVTFTVTDSRGYTTSVTVEPDMVPYRKLTCNPAARRTDPTSGNAALTASGVYYNEPLGQTQNTLALRYRVNGGEWLDMTVELTEEGYTAQAALSALDYTQSHTLEVMAADRLMTVTKTLSLGKGLPVFDWGEGDFTFHVPVYFQGGLPQSILTEGETEWLSPPMEPGVEYRTIERHRGKPVYTALIDCGLFPGNSVVAVSHGKAVDQILRCCGYAEYYGCVLPYFDTDSTTQVAAEVTANRGKINVRTTTNAWTGYRCYAQIWYTK